MKGSSILQNKPGILFIISGPAGSGKGTIIKNLLEGKGDFVYSVSATTRAPRPGEENGVHYHFITREDFEDRIYHSTMLEYAEYCGNYYGTPRREVEAALAEGHSVILEIEVKGAMQVKRLFPEAVMVLILPPDFATLEARLRGRGTNDEDDIQNRLQTAKTELSHFDAYDYFVLNDNGKSDEAADTIRAIAEIEQHKVKRNADFPDIFFGRK